MPIVSVQSAIAGECARGSKLFEAVVVPALLVGERGLHAARPAMRSPKARAALAVPLIAVLIRVGAGHPADADEATRARTGWPFAALIQQQAARHKLDPALVAAVISQESRFDPAAINERTGAQGLMQLTPVTSRALGVTDPTNPRQSVAAGCRYLRQLLDRFNGNLALALAAYNAGPTVVARMRRIPPFPETRRYVATVSKRFALFRADQSV